MQGNSRKRRFNSKQMQGNLEKTRFHNVQARGYSKRHKKFNYYERDWPNLMEDLLLNITRRLSIIDLFAFSGACKSWRTFFKECSNHILASHPPIYAEIIRYSMRDFAVFMYIPIHEIFARYFINSVKTCVFLGYSQGFFMFHFRGKRVVEFALLHPLTNQWTHPFPPFKLKCKEYHHWNSYALTAPISSPNCRLLFLDRNYIWCCRLGDTTWTKLKYSIDGFESSKMAFAHGNMYSLYRGQEGQFKVVFAKLQLLDGGTHATERMTRNNNIKFMPVSHNCLDIGDISELYEGLLSILISFDLVASSDGENLFLVVGPLSLKRRRVFQLNPTTNEWTLVDSSGDAQRMFLATSDKTTLIDITAGNRHLHLPTRWKYFSKGGLTKRMKQLWYSEWGSVCIWIYPCSI